MTMEHRRSEQLPLKVTHGNWLPGKSPNTWPLAKSLRTWLWTHQNSNCTMPRYLVALGTFEPSCITWWGPLHRGETQCSMFHLFLYHGFGLRNLMQPNGWLCYSGLLFRPLLAIQWLHLGKMADLLHKLPPPDHPPAIWSPPPPVPKEEPPSNPFSADGQTMEAPARAASDDLSADDASTRTPSRKSSVRYSPSVIRLSADYASLAPTISSEPISQNNWNRVMLIFRLELPLLQLPAPDLVLTEDHRTTITKHRQRISLRTMVLLLQDSRPLSAPARWSYRL